MKSKVRCAKSFFICNVAKGISWLNTFVLQYYIIVRIKLSLKEKKENVTKMNITTYWKTHFSSS